MDRSWINEVELDVKTGRLTCSERAWNELVKLAGSKAKTIGGQRKAVKKLITQAILDSVKEKK